MNCEKCNQSLQGNETACPNCGSFVSYPNNVAAPVYTALPAELKKWNWGAFMFNIFWGIGNHSYLPLLCFIPLFNIIWVFVCGAKGNEWAWKSGKFNNLDHFLAAQETWNRAGFVYFIILAAFLALYLIFGLLIATLTFNTF